MSTSIEQLLAGNLVGGAPVTTLAPVDSGVLLSLTFDQIQFNGPVTMNGNLMVLGTTTTVNSTVVDIKDRVVHVNHSPGPDAPVPVAICGVSAHRGDITGVNRDHAGIFWDEGAAAWKFAWNTSGDDSTLGSYLPVYTGNLNMTGFTCTGDVLFTKDACVIGHSGGTSLVIRAGQSAMLQSMLSTASVSGVGATVDGTTGNLALNGTTITDNQAFVSASALAIGDLVGISDAAGTGKLAKTDATNSDQHAIGVVNAVIGAGDTACLNKVTTMGMAQVSVEAGHGAMAAAGVPLYMSKTTTGTVTASAPAVVGNTVFIVGYLAAAWAAGLASIYLQPHFVKNA